MLLLLGIDIVNGEGGGGATTSLAKTAGESSLDQAESVYRRIVIPMAMPLLVGPGVIANVIL